MIITQNNRVYTTAGQIFSDLDEVKAYIKKHPTEILTIHLNQVTFLMIDDMIHADLGIKKLPFSELGLKSLCAILKVPFSYLNKLLLSSLVLKNLNESPNLFKDEFLFYVHTSEEGQEYISAVSNNESFNIQNAIDILDKSELFNNIPLKLLDVTLSNEGLSLYYMTDIEVDIKENQKFTYGLYIFIPEGIDVIAEISPFIRMDFEDHQSFDFISSPMKKIRRSEKSFSIVVKDEMDHLSSNLLAEKTDELLKLLEAALNSSDLTYLELKRLKNTISSTFRFQNGVYDTQNIIAEILPEYDTFRNQYKEEIRTKPTFEINNYKIPFSLPKLFSAFEGHVFTLENPIFFNRQRKNVFKFLKYHADIYYATP